MEPPPVQGYNELYFTLFLPSGPRPEAGWPVAIAGHGAVANRRSATGEVGVMEVGMDVDGDGSPELDPNRMFYFGNSAGATYGAVFLALEPSIYAAALGVSPGMSPEHGRWAPGRRPGLGNMLGARTPSLLNSPGIIAA
jgi:hypothetical protein